MAVGVHDPACIQHGTGPATQASISLAKASHDFLIACCRSAGRTDDGEWSADRRRPRSAHEAPAAATVEQVPPPASVAPPPSGSLPPSQAQPPQAPQVEMTDLQRRRAEAVAQARLELSGRKAKELDPRRRGLPAEANEATSPPAKKTRAAGPTSGKQVPASKSREDIDRENRQARADRSGRWRRGGSPPPTGGICVTNRWRSARLWPDFRRSRAHAGLIGSIVAGQGPERGPAT